MSENPNPSNPSNFSPSNWDASVIIALIAVLISSASTWISLKESGIMVEQQQILSSQQEASVWPYLENRRVHSRINDTTISFQYKVVNKGIGPAIIDSVKYLFNDQEVTGWGLGEAMSKAYPQYTIRQGGNSTLDGNVLAPGESHIVIKETIIKSKNDTLNLFDFLNTMDFHLEYCYCSVYGKCWKVESIFETHPSEECSFRSDIR